MLKYNYKIADSIGGRNEQQDFSGTAETKFGLLVVVCDGMGGAKGGATASRMAVNIILQDIANNNYNSPSTALLEAIKKANFEIFNRSRTNENCKGMGTTATAIFLQEEKATIAHVGDSRVYQLRSPGLFGKSTKKIFRTNDHSKVFELVKRGILNEEQARISDESNVILRALGIKPEVTVEINDDIPYLKGDRFLLCTDGVSGAVPESVMLEMLNQHADVDITVNKLIAAIDQTGYKNGGGHDNLTAALIECSTNSNLKSPTDMKTKILLASLTALLVISLSYIGYNKLSGTSTAQKESEALIKEKEQSKKQIDSLINITLSLSDSLKKEKQKPSNIERSLPQQGDTHNKTSVDGITESLLKKNNDEMRLAVKRFEAVDKSKKTGKGKPGQDIDSGKNKKEGGNVKSKKIDTSGNGQQN